MKQFLLIGEIIDVLDPKELNTGSKMAQFVVAVKRANAEDEQFLVTTWNGLADVITNNAVIGKTVAIDGRLQSNNYIRDDGKRAYRTNLTADRISFVGGLD